MFYSFPYATPKPKLFTLEFEQFEAGSVPCCQEEQSKAVAGDKVNASVFWAERYYPKFKPLRLPVEQLIPLAANLILSASHLNSKEVEGLDIVLCEASGIRRLSDESIDTLRLKVGEWDETIGKLFLNHQQEYTFTPTARGDAL